MWFVFGFFSLSSFAAVVLYRRLTQGWTGIPSVVHGMRYEYQILRNSQTDREFALRIGVAAPSDYARSGVIGSLNGLAFRLSFKQAIKRSTEAFTLFPMTDVSIPPLRPTRIFGRAYSASLR